MGTKITLTITPDTEYLAPNEIDAAMLRTVRVLQQLGDAPLRKFVLNFECKDEHAEDVKDQIHAALSARPVGIDALLKTTCEERVARETMPRTTPMDEEGWEGEEEPVASDTIGARAMDWLVERES